MDKKFLVILIIIAAAVLVGTGVYRYSTQFSGNTNTQDSAGGAKTEAPETDSQNTPEISDVQVQTENGSGAGGLIICVDKCGDNVCQKTDPTCDQNSMNCVCPETPQDCSQDCK